jgi:ankyrin repeat protein
MISSANVTTVKFYLLNMQFGATALIFCAMCGQFDICLLLVSKGADLFLKNNVSAYSSLTDSIFLTFIVGLDG